MEPGIAHSNDLERRFAIVERIVNDGPLRLSNENDALATAHQTHPKRDLA